MIRTSVDYRTVKKWYNYLREKQLLDAFKRIAAQIEIV